MDMRSLLCDLLEVYYDDIALGYDTDVWWWTHRVNAAISEHRLVRAEIKWLIKRINRFIRRVEGKNYFGLAVK